MEIRIRVFEGVSHGARKFGEELPETSREFDLCVIEGTEWCLRCEERCGGNGGFGVVVVCG